MSCPEHGVVIERVPWALHGFGFTKAFEEQVAWLAGECSKTAVANLMRIAWRTVGRILERVAKRLLGPRRQLAGLRRIGITRSPSARASATRRWWSTTRAGA